MKKYTERLRIATPIFRMKIIILYTPPSFRSHYSDTEAVIPCLTDSESESEDEDEHSFNALPTTFTDSSATLAATTVGSVADCVKASFSRRP